MSRPLRRTAEEIQPAPALKRQLAEEIVKILIGNPVMASTWQYERIVELIDKYEASK